MVQNITELNPVCRRPGQGAPMMWPTFIVTHLSRASTKSKQNNEKIVKVERGEMKKTISLVAKYFFVFVPNNQSHSYSILVHSRVSNKGKNCIQAMLFPKWNLSTRSELSVESYYITFSVLHFHSTSIQSLEPSVL